MTRQPGQWREGTQSRMPLQPNQRLNVCVRGSKDCSPMVQACRCSQASGEKGRNRAEVMQ